MMKSSPLKTLAVLAGILLIASLAVGYYLFVQSKEAKDSTASLSLTVDEGLPYTDAEGAVVDLAQYANEIRVVNSWASWSPLSREELPLLNEVAAAYKDRDVVFLAINRKETKEYAGAYLSTLPALDDLMIVFDPADNFFAKVAGYAMPETIVFDKDGSINTHIRGSLNKEELTVILDNLLSSEN